MRRADRLFQIIERLRGRRALTARALAERLAVSERTVYRDMADLVASGVPVEGAAGVGYVLRSGFDLPPIMFDREELEAIVAGVRFVQGLGGDTLAEAASRVLAKVEAVLPATRRIELRTPRLFVSPFAGDTAAASQLDLLRRSINRQRVLRLHYRREDGERSVRRVRPLCLFYWPPYWLLSGWCELREDFRNFRVDRIESAEDTGDGFKDEPGRRFEDFLAGMCAT